MNIFSKVFTQQKQSSNTTKDERKAECPYCHKGLSKIPGAKTKCPHCGEFIFVRTRPKDNARVVVTKAEADKIDEEWTIVAGTHDIFVAEKEEFAKQKEILRKRFGGKEPSDNDVRWGLLNKQIIESAKNSNWGLYRNAKFQMGEILRNEMKPKEALKYYFEVCYLDLNGPRNIVSEQFPSFDADSLGFLAPGVVDRINKIVQKMNLSKDEIKHIFIESNLRSEKSLRLPLSTEQAWLLLDKEL